MSTSSPGSAASAPRTERRRGRRPADAVRAEVLAATADLLFRDGLAAVTFDRVAQASGASKTTVYKWWPTPGALAAEAYFTRVEHDLDFVDTGSIERDVRDQLNAFVRLMVAEPAGHAVRQLIGAAQTDPELRAAFTTVYSRPRRQEAVDALRTAQRRGQIRDDLPLEILVDQLWGACYHRILILDETLDARIVDQLVRNAFHGAAPRGGR